MAILYITGMAFVTYLIRDSSDFFSQENRESLYPVFSLLCSLYLPDSNDFSGDILCDQQRLKRISWCGCCRGTCFL